MKCIDALGTDEKKEIEILEEKHKNKEIKFYYFDGSHFSLTPSVPYAWQEKGNEIEFSPKKGGSQNVLGLITPDNEFKFLVFGNQKLTQKLSFIHLMNLLNIKDRV